MAKLNIVLHEPEIPANTGNIGRTCVATGTRLHLIEPLGFSLSEKALKRAGMDYWKDLDVTRYVDYERRFTMPLPKLLRPTRMYSMRTIASSCLAKRAPEFRKRF